MSKKSLPRETPALAHQPFASLGARMPSLTQSDPSITPPEVPKSPSRAVVRLERKGRGGKEVTIVEQLGLDARQSGEWLHAIKAALGCGGADKDGTWVLQGDQRKRACEWLRARGVTHVAVSG